MLTHETCIPILSSKLLYLLTFPRHWPVFKIMQKSKMADKITTFSICPKLSPGNLYNQQVKNKLEIALSITISEIFTSFLNYAKIQNGSQNCQNIMKLTLESCVYTLQNQKQAQDCSIVSKIFAHFQNFAKIPR